MLNTKGLFNEKLLSAGNMGNVGGAGEGSSLCPPRKQVCVCLTQLLPSWPKQHLQLLPALMSIPASFKLTAQ